MTFKGKQMVISSSDGSNLTIDARLLHSQLQVSTIFANWIRRRINEFGFEEGTDFFPKMEKSKRGKYQGGRKTTNYELTLDMAKELAMLERNVVGQRIRRYFIAMEKEARAAYESGRILPKRVHSKEINGRKIYPFRSLVRTLGYNPGGGLYYRRKVYPAHFIRLDRLWYCSEEMANLLAMGISVRRHRETIKQMQPILPPTFGQGTLQLMEGASL